MRCLIQHSQAISGGGGGRREKDNSRGWKFSVHLPSLCGQVAYSASHAVFWALIDVSVKTGSHLKHVVPRSYPITHVLCQCVPPVLYYRVVFDWLITKHYNYLETNARKLPQKSNAQYQLLLHIQQYILGNGTTYDYQEHIMNMFVVYQNGTSHGESSEADLNLHYILKVGIWRF